MLEESFARVKELAAEIQTLAREVWEMFHQSCVLFHVYVIACVGCAERLAFTYPPTY